MQRAGFRLVLFSFVDLGLIGDQSNIFRNDFFGTFGLGVRIRNERLIFNAIQLRIGFAFGKEGFMKNDIFRMSSQQRIEQTRFLPGRPEVVSYR